jgi:hypothetical protein
MTIKPTLGRDLPPFVPTFYPIVVAVTYLGLLVVGLGVSIYSVARVLVVSMLVVALISAVINIVMRDRNRGGVLALVVVFLALFAADPRVVAVALLIGGLVIIERVISIRRATRVPWRTINLVGNAVAVVMVLTLVISGLQNGAWGRIFGELALRPVAATAHSSTASGPDIYVILLDGYERPNKMQELFGFDDGPFTRQLADRGFEVADRSRSNYLLTALSVPSLLNMRHVDDLFPAKGYGDGQYRATVRSFSANNAVFREMQDLGYETIAVASGFEEVVVRDADRAIDTGQLNEYEMAMARETAVGSWINTIAPAFFADAHRSRVLETLHVPVALAEGSHDRALFAFVHVPSPHGPIVFGPRGEPIPAPPLGRFYHDDAHDLGLSRAEFGRRYVGQVEYLNGRVIETVDRILAGSPEPPVIILLSDHGSGSGLDWLDLDHSDLDERSANLFAAYTPGRSHVFPDDISLVNVFGTLLGAYFEVDVPAQPNTIYRWNDGLTRLIEVPESVVPR